MQSDLLFSGIGLQIMMLKPDTPESKLLVDWVEGGETLSFLSLSHVHTADSCACRYKC